MIFERGTPANTLSTVPTRRFTFVLDPKCLPGLAKPGYAGIVALAEDLRRIVPPVTITFALPRYLGDAQLLGYAETKRPILCEIERPNGVPSITLSQRLPREHRDRLSGATEGGARAIALTALSEFIQADGIVTDDPRLVEARYPLLQHHRLRVIPLEECADWIEVCAHGHDVFWSATDYSRALTVDGFYQSTHWKNRRLAQWFLASFSLRVLLGLARRSGGHAKRDPEPLSVPFILS